MGNEIEAQLAGDLAALRVVINALIKTHPDPRALADAIAEAASHLLAIGLDSPLPDTILEAVQETLDEFEQRARSAVQPSPE